MPDSESIVIDTPEGIAHFAYMQVVFALALEINTGMKASRGSILALAQRRGMTDKRTKKAALTQIIEGYESLNPGWERPATIVRAIGAKS